MIKMAMLAVDEWLAGSAIDARMIMQVHDELVFEVEAGAVDELCEAVGRRCQTSVRRCAVARRGGHRRQLGRSPLTGISLLPAFPAVDP